MVCDYLGGELRGYVRHDPGAAGRRCRRADAQGAVRQGLSRDHLRPAGRQGALPGDRAARGQEPRPRRRRAISRSPSRSRAWSGSRRRRRDGHWFAGGLLLQHLPEGEEGRERLHTRLDHPDWPHVAILGGSVKAEELTDPELPLDDLIWRLFHEEEEVRTLAAITLSRGCRCDPDYVRSVIARFPADEREAMVGDDGVIRVDCAFCSSSFADRARRARLKSNRAIFPALTVRGKRAPMARNPTLVLALATWRRAGVDVRRSRRRRLPQVAAGPVGDQRRARRQGAGAAMRRRCRFAGAVRASRSKAARPRS